LHTLTKLLLFPVLGIALFASEPCEALQESSEQIKLLSKKAKQAENILEVHTIARKVMQYSDEAMDIAQACECEAALDTAANVFALARGATNKLNTVMAAEQIHKASNRAEKLRDFAKRCDHKLP